MNKIKVWTRLDQSIVNQIHENGFYRLSKQELEAKYDDCLPIYLHIYDWYREKTKLITTIPNEALYPVLVSTTLTPELAPTETQVLLELEVDSKDIIFTDAAKWSYILNYWYLPKNDKDNEAFKGMLESRGLSNQTQVYMSHFYPEIKEQIHNSWDRLFDETIQLSEEKKATLWEIRKEWIVKESKI